jgi:hypothetical protein
VALAFLPGTSFYYDVIPKAVALLGGAGLLCVWAAWRHGIPAFIWTSRVGRWNAILAGAAILVMLGATLSSPLHGLAWEGSEWRRLGALEWSAIIVAAVLASTHRLPVLRGLCWAGIAAALYGIAQYFGWDPWLDASGYHFGEGVFQIVRPPGPMGHSNYLAAFLLWPVFCGAALWRSDPWLARASALTGVIAILLCGSRGALAGLAAGAIMLLFLDRPCVRVLLTGIALAATLGGAFYLSPYGEPLRARVFWIGEDAAGGSRLLMWRDSLRMGLERPLTGIGPEAFATEFPLHQSAELSRQFPDFYHESPHNMFLDVFVAQGIPGVLIWMAWIGLALFTAKRAFAGPQRTLAVGLAAGLVAAVVAHQFAVLVIPTAFAMLLGMVMLTSLDPTPSVGQRVPWRIACLLLAGLFFFEAQRLWRADAALAQVQQADSASAGELWRETRDASVSANLPLSRRWTAEAFRATTALEKLRWSQIAGEAALAATQDLEQRQNAWYNLAILQASANNAAGVEQSLRAAIAAAPTWYKPHWTLARLLASTGRMADAQQEARIALDLNGARDAEVVATMGEILRSVPAGK